MDTIKKLRLEKKYTQSQLADILNIDQTTVSKWELGKAIPDTPTLIKLSQLFDVSTDFLLGISTYYYPDKIKEKGIKKENPSFNPEEEQLLDDFRSLPRQERVQATEYVHFLAERRGNKNKNA